MPSSVETTLKRIDRRLKKLEAVSHKQPDMKEIIRDIAKVMKGSISKPKLDRIRTTGKVRC